MEDFKKLSFKIDSCLQKNRDCEVVQTLAQLGINTEGKPDTISNKRKLIRWIRKIYQDIMKDVDKKPEERKSTFARFAVFCGEG